MREINRAFIRIFSGDRHSARLIFFVVAIMCLLVFLTQNQANLRAFGCDSFGYARQAELFRHKGFIGGLDTKFSNDEAQQLIQVAYSIHPDSGNWSEAIAPHCHHYEKATGQIILQYPPGTGMVLALFPERFALAYVFIIGMTLVAAAYTISFARHRPAWPATLLAVATFSLLAWTMAQSMALASASIPVTVSIIPLAAALSFVAFSGPHAGARPVPALAFGVLCGLMLSVRLPNVFLLIGLASQTVLTMRLWRLTAIRNALPALLLAFAGFCATGLFPVLGANLINAGGIFSTTYSPIDASPPVLDWSLILENLAYYFGTGFAASALIGACAILGFRLATRKRYPAADGIFGASIGALIALTISVVFFSTHSIRIPYYLLPASVLVLCMVAFEFMGSGRPDRFVSGSRSMWLVLLLPIILVALVRLGQVNPYTPKTILPQEVKSENAIVWADLNSGTVIHYQDKYAAKLNFTGDEIQDKLIDALSELGWTQYFIVDSPSMQSIHSRLSSTRKLTKGGVFNAESEYPIWKLEPE